ncbi:oligosaccharide flippase family protein [Salibacteraceae bacterium]|nr:oligosaccharide flippase family protein [Salibacteraceae bacterium]
MGVNRNFSINLIFLLGLNLLVKPFYLFGVEVGVQNAVGAEDYGLYYAMFNFTFLFNVLLDLGINNFQKIKVAQDAESGMQNMATLLPMKILLSGLYMVVTIVAALIIGFEGDYWFFIGWLMINHILSVFLLMFRANLAGLHLFIRDSFLSVIDRLLMIVGVGYLLWFGSEKFEIEAFVLLQTAAYAFAIVLALILTPAGKRLILPKVSMPAMVSMAKQTWPFALLILLMTAYNKLDGIMLERLADEGTLEAGIYAQAFRILDAGNSFAFLYAGLLLPMFARMLHEGKAVKELYSLVDQACRLLIIPAGVVCIISLFFGDWLMHLLYDEHADESALSLVWLMGSFVFLASGYVFGTLITASAEMKALNWIAFGTVLLNVVLNWMLIPEYGSEGAAFTSFISLGFMAIAQILFSYQKFDLALKPWLMRAIILWALALLAVFVASYFKLSPLVAIFFVLGISVVSFFTFVIDRSMILDEIRKRT